MKLKRFFDKFIELMWMMEVMESSRDEINATSDRVQTQVLINLANVVDYADGQMLPAVYGALERTLGFSPTQNGAITAARSLLQSLSTPFWGWLSDHHSRKKLLSSGSVLWGLFTIMVAFSWDFTSMLFFRVFTGIGLAVIFPTAQSIIADYFEEHERGRAFGWLGLTGVLGAITGTIFATSVSDITIMGIDGWRAAFLLIAFISIGLGVLVWIFATDPVRGGSERELAGLIDADVEEKYKLTTSDYKRIMTNKTFLLILLQGVVGLIPWNAIFFVILWFEYVGFGAVVAGLAFSVIAIGAAAGNLFGGWIGDKAARWNPDKGRIIVAQVSVFSGIPMMIVIFKLVPRVATTEILFMFILLGMLTGFLISWVAPACNYPIFSELFEPEIRSSVYAIDRLFEGSIAASGTLIVGFLAEKMFNYITPSRGVSIQDLPDPIRLNNVEALANAMILATVFPWLLCLLFFTLVYFTYPTDRDRMKRILLQRQRELIGEKFFPSGEGSKSTKHEGMDEDVT